MRENLKAPPPPCATTSEPESASTATGDIAGIDRLAYSRSRVAARRAQRVRLFSSLNIDAFSPAPTAILVVDLAEQHKIP